ncbi:hypothetical protein T05_13980 [Trichinella murrelli]|uniref:Uncharacterized protein n=1 Tax=Trichinella murrelli TaxID=144512 RepID=A0A0V0TPZ7_9BILA|nr:hypothetical protein T05_13980 [Trichinella murrelli]
MSSKQPSTSKQEKQNKLNNIAYSILHKFSGQQCNIQISLVTFASASDNARARNFHFPPSPD